MIFLVTIPLLGIGLALVIRAAMPIFRRVFRKYDALNDSVQENVQGHARCQEPMSAKIMRRRNSRLLPRMSAATSPRPSASWRCNNPMMQFCVYAGMAFVLSFGSYPVITSQGTELDCRPDVRHADLQLPDSDEPDDACPWFSS